MGRSRGTLSRRMGFVILVLVCSFRFARSQAAASNSAAASPAAIVEHNLHGTVVNALSGAPITRALVLINGRSMLTDSEGKFAFAGFTDMQAFITVTKPGFSQSLDPTTGGKRLTDLDSAVELKLYPHAIIAGVVTGRDGLPLSGIQIMLQRLQYQPGESRWVGSGVQQTNLRGEYRFREPAGRYRLAVQYQAKTRDTGEAVIPITFPAGSPNDRSAYLEIAPAEERHVDLRPRTSLTYPLTVRVDADEAQRGVQFFAVTTNGDVFNVPASSQVQGTYQVTLPLGTFTLKGRLENRDATMEGTTRVTVTGPRSDPAALHLERATALPVEVSLDPASSSTSMTNGTAVTLQPPDPRQLNLRLVPLSESQPQQDVMLRQKDDKNFEFRLSPGTYRLVTNFGGPWYVSSASYGTANLALSDIVISSGGSSAAIRLIVNNAFGTVTGTVKLPASVDLGWVYFFPRTPAVTPVNPVGMQNGGIVPGTFTMRLPVGEYMAVALDHRLQADLRDPEELAKLMTDGRPVEVTAGATATVELPLSQVKELTQ